MSFDRMGKGILKGTVVSTGSLPAPRTQVDLEREEAKNIGKITKFITGESSPVAEMPDENKQHSEPSIGPNESCPAQARPLR